MKKVLLLNSSYEPLSFITEKRAIKLLFKDDKVEVISSWPIVVKMISGNNFDYPSILRLKKHVKKVFLKTSFSRTAVVKRDKAICQYCDEKLQNSQVTIDHVLPKSHGGKSTFLNCVVACKSCNNRKADRTPEQARMPLLRQPIDPKYVQGIKDHHNVEEHEDWNHEWDAYFNG